MSTYGCTFWWTGTNRMRDNIISSQRMALLDITRCFRTTSTIALQVLAGTLLLDPQVEKKSVLSHVLRLAPRERCGDRGHPHKGGGNTTKTVSMGNALCKGTKHRLGLCSGAYREFSGLSRYISFHKCFKINNGVGTGEAIFGGGRFVG